MAFYDTFKFATKRLGQDPKTAQERTFLFYNQYSCTLLLVKFNFPFFTCRYLQSARHVGARHYTFSALLKNQHMNNSLFARPPFCPNKSWLSNFGSLSDTDTLAIIQYTHKKAIGTSKNWPIYCIILTFLQKHK